MPPIISNPPIAAPPIPPSLPETTTGKSTYGQILKSSVLIGGSSAINIAIGIVRTKAMALMLGPAGIGLMALFNSIADLTRSVAEMGINSSGVRQIAEAVGSGDTERIARTVVVLRRISILLGIFGAVLLVVFCSQVSILTFGSGEQAAAVALLSFAVFSRLVSDGQGALIQGMRRISDLAKMGVLGALFGTAISIVLVYFLREKGIVPSLVAVAALSLLASWWYARKIEIQIPAMTASQVGLEAGALLKLGFAFMVSGMLTMGSAYVIRLIIVRRMGVDAAGFYQSAWALGGLYIGFILQAMGTDFYPRLTGISKDNAECNRLVNEQAQISLLMAGPGVIATLTLAPLVIASFYSQEFSPAVDILRWICLGMTFRVIAWPMGYIVLAKGEQAIFFWNEVAATVVHIGLAWLCIVQFGLAGAGAAFFGLCLCHGVLIYVIVRRLSGFRWSVANRKVGIRFLSLIGLIFSAFYLLPFWLATTAGALATLLSGIYSIRVLISLVSSDRIPSPIRRLLQLLRFAPSRSRERKHD